MSKTKKISLAVVIAMVVILAGYKTWQKIHSNTSNNQVAQDNSSIIFFYGAACPHCQDVEKYIADHQLDQKVVFSKREVWGDTANANLMAEKAQACGLKLDDIGVPFLWSAGKCYVGENEVENFLDAAAAQK